MANFKDDVLTLQRLEPFGPNANHVLACSEIGSVIYASVIRGEGSSDAPLCIDDTYSGADNDAASLVGDSTENSAEAAL